MGFGSFVVAQFSDPEKLLPAVKDLAHRHDVLRWDAVDGKSQLIVRTRSSPTALNPESALAIDGSDRVITYSIVTKDDKDEVIDPTLCRAYVFIEVEPLKCGEVLNFLRENEAVIQYSSVGNGSVVVALIQGKTFNTIDGVISRRLRALDGVLRLSASRVIELKTL